MSLLEIMDKSALENESLAGAAGALGHARSQLINEDMLLNEELKSPFTVRSDLLTLH